MRSSLRMATLVAALALPAPDGRAGSPRRALDLTPCQLAAPASATRVAARCGTLEVPEDRARPDGRRVTLRVAVIAAEAASPEVDAVYVLAGGPGQAATEAYAGMAPAFARLRRQRQIVLVDQRGTGGSGKLACPDVPEPARGRALPKAEQRRLVAACAEELAARADLAQYGTDAFVRDLDEVRAALGHPQVNLVGFSYGTRAALIYLRTFPDRVRTLVLDGVAPLEMAVGGHMEEDAQAALDAVLARCREAAACHARFPALDGAVGELLARLEETPARITARDPLTAEPRERTFDADDLRRVVMAFTYQPESAALLPPLLGAAVAGDLGPLASALSILSADFEAAVARPLQFSVVCAEDVPFIEDGPPGADRACYLGRQVRDEFRRVCAEWPVRPVPAAWRTPVRAKVPALVLSGGADPVTPPRWGELAARNLDGALHVVLPGQGHGVLMRGCLPRLAATFVEQGTADGLDVSCAALSVPAPLFIDAMGGTP